MHFGNRRFQRCPRGKLSSPRSSRRCRRTTGSEAGRGSEVPAPPRSLSSSSRGEAARMWDASESTDFVSDLALRGDTFASALGERLSSGGSKSSARAVSMDVSISMTTTGKIRGSASSDWTEGRASLLLSKTAAAAACGRLGIESAAGVGSLAAISPTAIVDGPKVFRALRLYSTTKGLVGRFMETSSSWAILFQ